MEESYKCCKCGQWSTPEDRVFFAHEGLCFKCLKKEAKRKRRVKAIAELIDQLLFDE